MTGPLSSKTRVLSFCHYLQGPACTQYLADMGADVIKIEPLSGAFERHWSGGNSWVTDVSAFSLAMNRNKRSLAVNLKTPEGLALVRKLAAQADILVENYRPGVMARLGLGYEDVRALNPGIIYASASAFGATGPAASRPGQDLLMQARSGLIAATGGARHTVVGAAVIDQHGAALLALGVLGAYIRRLQGGPGTRVESSLFGAGIDLQIEALTKFYSAPGGRDLLPRNEHVGSWYHDAPYGLYGLQDAEIVLSMNDPARLAEALDSDALRDLVAIDRYQERDRYAEVTAQVLAGHRFDTLSTRLDEHQIWYERVQDYQDLRADAQAQHLGLFQSIDVNGRTATLIGHPLTYDGARPALRAMPLYPGAHSREILQEMGVPPAQQDLLIRDGVIGEPSASRRPPAAAD
ncbi:CaiB/BaiF CoA transferase family protein [Castellaniella sp.]|uniref:CaiB/BaiF CoA transferase family protein n=1 Tax=Castellaniella sp. TaxID=1955812 RepID=UPI003C77C53A